MIFVHIGNQHLGTFLFKSIKILQRNTRFLQGLVKMIWCPVADS